jgi:hypothetical protein
MKKITLIATFSFFLGVAAYAQTDNKDAATPAPAFQTVTNTIQPTQQQPATVPHPDAKQTSITAGQNQTMTMVKDNNAVVPASTNKMSAKANTSKVQPATTVPATNQNGSAVQNTVTPK